MDMAEVYDVVVVGGSAAGLSGALVLARSRRYVLVIDSGDPRNAPAAGVHGFLTRDGMSPVALVEAGRAEVRGYGGTVISGRVVSATRVGDRFTVMLDDDRAFTARRLLVTTGLVDELPDVPGVRERWGRDVLHCPYCHGWEVQDQAIGILATGPMAMHQTLLFRQLTDDLTLFLHTAPAPSELELEQLAARGVRVVTGEVAAIEVVDDHVTGVRLVSGELVPRQAIVVGPRFTARADVLISLGLRTTEHPVGTYIAADPVGLTEIPGVWVAGNVTDPMAQVVNAAAGGARAAAAINADLVQEDVALAVQERRKRSMGQAHSHTAVDGAHEPPTMDREFWEQRYRSQTSLWSGEPNPQLVTDAADLPAGRALDVGAGEGADALWLASRGWQVTAVDISSVALDRGAGHAGQAGADIAARIEWLQADLISWTPEPRTYDLVTAQFMHPPKALREPIFEGLAGSVAPGGTLLIVGHHPSDLQTTMPRPPSPGLFYTAEDIADTLTPDEWEIVACDARAREMSDPDGHPVTIHDTVLRARRRPA